MDVISNLDKLILKYKNEFKINKALCFTDKFVKNQIGVTSLIPKFYRSNNNANKKNSSSDFTIEMKEDDYETICTNIEDFTVRSKGSNDISAEHDAVLLSLFISSILGRNGFRVISTNEVFIGDKEIIIENPQPQSGYYTPLGIIDFLCLDSNNKLVLGEVKTSLKYYHGYTLENIFLKQDTARQLHIEGKILESMAKKHNIDLEVSYYIILGYQCPGDDETHLPKYGLWTVKNNPIKWIAGIDKNGFTTSFLPIQFNKIKLSKKEQRYLIAAKIDESVSGRPSTLLLCDLETEKERKYILYDYDTHQILLTFDGFKAANKWLMNAKQNDFNVLYKQDKSQICDIVLDF